MKSLRDLGMLAVAAVTGVNALNAAAAHTAGEAWELLGRPVQPDVAAWVLGVATALIVVAVVAGRLLENAERRRAQ